MIVLAIVGGITAAANATPAAADAIRDNEWHLSVLSVLQAQRISQGEGVIVALADTGVDAKHPDLAGAVLPGKGFGHNNTSDGRIDTDGHGTSMAGLIAGRGRPGGAGMLGIAPKTMILPIQTVRGELGNPEDLAAGVNWAVDEGAKVICIAAVTDEDATLTAAVTRAVAADVVVVASVGNVPDNQAVGYPARLPGVLAVGGTDRDQRHATVSAAGPEVVIVAPAVDIQSISAYGKYHVATGTSDAAAIVSGVVALVRAKFPGLSGPEVVRRITATAVDKGKPGRDEEFGFGVVDPLAALTATLPSAAPQVSAVPSEVGSGPAGGRGGVGGWGAWIAVVGVVAVGVVGVLRWRRWRAGS
ncbi:S8 family serine peptidase [Dactylosporangium matsuzakiense]|nr:S8 family serine peptidase [Dactylosporangium matsuzakiense]UWZ46582.1 S8 family serine peptidase [Dactylosporangium matsuzakiense]